MGFNPIENENHFDRKLRPFIIGALGGAGDEQIITEVRKRFAQHFEGKQLVEPDCLNLTKLYILI